MDAYSFMVQQRTFAVHGYAVNPSTASANGIVGSTADAAQNGYAPIDAIRASKTSRREQKRKRAGKGDAGVVEGDEAYMGPWAAYESEKVDEVVEEDPEADEEWREEKRRRDEAKEAALAKVKEAKVEKSIFHGQYQSPGSMVLRAMLTVAQARSSRITRGGRICTSRPIRMSSSTRRMGQRHQIRISPNGVYTHGSVGVGAWTQREIQLTIPAWPQQGCLRHQTLPQKRSSPTQCQYGHKDQGAWRISPLGGTADETQLWDVYHEGNCLRTFMGHSQALKDIAFNNKGDKFLSASYDRYIKQWDTETGQCIQVFSNGKIPNCVTYNPDGDKQNIFLAGMQDKKIIQVSGVDRVKKRKKVLTL